MGCGQGVAAVAVAGLATGGVVTGLLGSSWGVDIRRRGGDSEARK